MAQNYPRWRAILALAAGITLLASGFTCDGAGGPHPEPPDSQDRIMGGEGSVPGAADPEPLDDDSPARPGAAGQAPDGDMQSGPTTGSQSPPAGEVNDEDAGVEDFEGADGGA